MGSVVRVINTKYKKRDEYEEHLVQLDGGIWSTYELPLNTSEPQKGLDNTPICFPQLGFYKM